MNGINDIQSYLTLLEIGAFAAIISAAGTVMRAVAWLIQKDRIDNALNNEGAGHEAAQKSG
jgi:hypothetical protein